MIADRLRLSFKVSRPRSPHKRPPCSPAKAGAQSGSPPSRGNSSRCVARTPPRPPTITPAKAGAQLGDGGNAGHRVVTAPFPPGPRPPPGWSEGCDLHHPVHPQTPPAPFPTTPAKAGAQLGDGGNEGKRDITATFPPGPRPSPGWSSGGGRPRGWYRGQRKRPPHQPRHPHPAPPPRQMQPQILPAPRRHAIARA